MTEMQSRLLPNKATAGARGTRHLAKQSHRGLPPIAHRAFWQNKATATILGSACRCDGFGRTKPPRFAAGRAPCVLAEQSHRDDLGIGLSL
jgi:hypothetical protein